MRIHYYLIKNTPISLKLPAIVIQALQKTQSYCTEE